MEFYKIPFFDHKSLLFLDFSDLSDIARKFPNNICEDFEEFEEKNFISLPLAIGYKWIGRKLSKCHQNAL